MLGSLHTAQLYLWYRTTCTAPCLPSATRSYCLVTAVTDRDRVINRQQHQCIRHTHLITHQPSTTAALQWVWGSKVHYAVSRCHIQDNVLVNACLLSSSRLTERSNEITTGLRLITTAEVFSQWNSLHSIQILMMEFRLTQWENERRCFAESYRLTALVAIHFHCMEKAIKSKWGPSPQNYALHSTEKFNGFGPIWGCKW